MRALLLVCVLSAAASAQGSLVTQLQERVDQIQSDYKVPSIAVSVVVGNAIVYTYTPGYGNVVRDVEATKSSSYAITSVTKTLTATALLRLLQKTSSLSRTSEVGDLLEGVVDSASDFNGMTFEHVLSHRISFTPVAVDDADPNSDHTVFDDDELPLWRYPARSLDKPLKRWSIKKSDTAVYGNESYLIAGYLLARLATGDRNTRERSVADYQRAMSKLLYQRVGMKRTTHSPTPRMVEFTALPYEWSAGRYKPVAQSRYFPMPAGETYSNVIDLGLFLRAHLTAGPLGKLRTATVTPMRESHAVDVDGFHHGLGWWIWSTGGRTYVDHDGDRTGYRAYLVCDPEIKAGLTFLTNGVCADGIIDQFYWLAVDVLTQLAGVNTPLPIVDLELPVPPPLPEPPQGMPPDTFLLTRGIDTMVAQVTEQGLLVAPPGDLWLLAPQQGNSYLIAPSRGGAFRKMPNPLGATVNQGGIVWGPDLVQRPFVAVGRPNLTKYEGRWGGTLHSVAAEPLKLAVGRGKVRLTVGDAKALNLVPASDGSGRLVATIGRSARDMVRILLEPHAGDDELVGTWQSGPRRYLIHLRRGAAAGWQARFSPRQWVGRWRGDVARGVAWTTGEVAVTGRDKALVDFGALGMKRVPIRKVRFRGNRVEFYARSWRFRGRIVGPFMVGEAKAGHNVAAFSLRRR